MLALSPLQSYRHPPTLPIPRAATALYMESVNQMFSIFSSNQIATLYDYDCILSDYISSTFDVFFVFFNYLNELKQILDAPI